MEKKLFDPFIEITFALIFVSILTYSLSVGKELLIPFVIALVLWYLTMAFASAIQKLKVIHYQCSSGIALVLAILIGMGLFVIILYMLSKNIYNVIYHIPKYQENLTKMLNHTLDRFHIKSVPLNNWLSMFEKTDVLSWMTRAAQTLTDIISLTGIILVYYIFLMFENKSIEPKIIALFTDKRKLTKTRKILKTINQKLQSYVWIKTMLSLVTAIASYAVLHFVGVDFSEFWASLIFLLNYIPTIGSIIAIIFPCLLSLVQFDTSWLPFLITLCSLISIQFVVGNIIEPRIMGESFNLSALIILISLVIWGKIWGITGMFLCVPIMVMAYIIFSQFQRTRWLAVLLSANGRTL